MLMDNDTVALEAARENVPGARIDGRHAPRRCGQGRPTPPFCPIRRCTQGIAEDHAQLERLVADAPAHLAPGGLLQMVVQRRVPLDRMLAEHFAKVDCRRRDGPLSRVAGDSAVTKNTRSDPRP